MSFRLTLGAALLSMIVALNANAAFAQDSRPKGKVCVENAGAFVIQTYFVHYDINFRSSVTTDEYPVQQTRCADFTESDHRVWITVRIIMGVVKTCSIDLRGRVGQTITATMYGTTLINQLDCSR